MLTFNNNSYIFTGDFTVWKRCGFNPWFEISYTEFLKERFEDIIRTRKRVNENKEK